MKQGIALIVLISAVALLAVVVVFFTQTGCRQYSTTYCYQVAGVNITPVFSPDNSQPVFDLISSARHEIKLEVYEFSSRDLADALIRSREAGIDVKVILEPSVYQNKNTMDYLINNGIYVNWASEKFHNTHSKFMVIDGSVVLVGSMNWSEYALHKNREASVIIYSKEVAAEFEKIFDSDFNG